MSCPFCGTSREPYYTVEIGSGKRYICPECEKQVPAPSPPEAQPTQPAKQPAQSTQAPVAPPSSPIVLEQGEPLDILKAARARRRWLTTQLRQAKAWKRELDSLTRLLAAAGTKRAPRAPKG